MKAILRAERIKRSAKKKVSRPNFIIKEDRLAELAGGTFSKESVEDKSSSH